MRLVKLFSILLCIVLCISLSTVTVFAARVVDEDGWYSFTSSDLVEVIAIDTLQETFYDKAFPIRTTSNDYFGIMRNYYVDAIYDLDSENGWIVVPAGYTIEFQTRVAYYGYIGSDTNAVAGFGRYPFSFSSVGEDNTGTNLKVSTSSYTLVEGRADIAFLSLEYTNNTGNDVYFNSFRWGTEDGLTAEDMKYAINISWVKFRMLNADEVMTDQILNGWDGSGNIPPEQEKVDEVGGVEEEVLGKVEDGATEAGTLFNDFGSQILAFVPAFTVIGRCFGNFMEIPLLSALLFIGLTIGVSGFLLGTLPSVASAIRGNQMAKQQADRRSANTSSNNKGSQKG